MAATDYSVNLDRRGTNVDIMVETIEHNFDKMLSSFHLPELTDYLIDLNRLKEAITITGWLDDTDASPALTKKNVLRSLLQDTGNITISWGTDKTGTGGRNDTQSYIGNILKGSITEVPGRRGYTGSGAKTFTVQIQFELGEEKG